MENKRYRVVIVILAVFSALTLISVLPAHAAENATITGDGVRVRNVPSVDVSIAEVIGNLAKGTRVEVRRESNFLNTIDGYTAPWYEIAYDGQTGFVFGRYVKIDPGAKVDVDFPGKNADWSNRVARFVRDNLVSLGATQSDIVGRLGEPASSENITAVEAGETVTNRKITYDGISFELYGQGPQDGTPYRLTCTSGAYDFGGLKVGSSMTDVKRLLGEPERVDGDRLVYGTILSAYLAAVFKIENGKVTWILLENVLYD